ncbi:MAG TPA: hypothetical protein VGE52_02790 [Pirellulales bacterium]
MSESDSILNDGVWSPEHEASPTRRAVLRYLMGLSAVGAYSAFDLAFPKRVRAAADPAGDAAWGTIKGRVVWDGDDAPARQAIDFSKIELNATDKQYFTSQGPVYNEDWVVDPQNKGVRWTFVWLLPESMEPDAKLTTHPDLVKPNADGASVNQLAPGFIPHSIAMREGEPLLVLNDSPIFHSFTWAGHPKRNQGGNQAMQPGSKFTIPDLMSDRTPIRLGCVPHPWERAWIRVFDHPYFALTDAEGRFEIKNAPAGKCRVVVWHESAGWKGGAQGRNGEPLVVEGGAIVDLGELKVRARPA